MFPLHVPSAEKSKAVAEYFSIFLPIRSAAPAYWAVPKKDFAPFGHHEGSSRTSRGFNRHSLPLRQDVLYVRVGDQVPVAPVEGQPIKPGGKSNDPFDFASMIRDRWTLGKNFIIREKNLISLDDPSKLIIKYFIKLNDVDEDMCSRLWKMLKSIR